MIRKTLLALGTMMCLTTQAAPVSYAFSGTVDDLPTGLPLSGQVRFEDSSDQLLSLDFSFQGQTYSLADADAGSTSLAFDAEHLLAGLDAVFSGLSGTLSLVDGFGAPYFVLVDANGTVSGSLSFSRLQVPEPALLPLLAVALAGVGRSRRRRA